jgi:cyclopropane fatty-acyl-phospholipid synthase-like methyltransferase
MDRSDWLNVMRREAEERYDTLWSPLYGEKLGLYSNATHQQFLQEFLRLLPEGGMILDAGCGAGRYLPQLVERGHRIVGIDQSAGMLARAKAKFPGVQLEKAGLQEMGYQGVFEGAICMDAMENICPEDWPSVLNNFQRALKQQGYLYFTVELAAEADVEAAFVRGQQLGWPVVYGEWADNELYHYYPSIEQVKEWLGQAEFDVWREGEGDEYYHFIVRKAS